MRRVTLATLSFMAFACLAQTAQAQDVSGDIQAISSYIDDDGFDYSDGPAVQGTLTINLGEHCSIDLWGSKTLSNNLGDELDAGASCRFNLDEKTEIEVAASQYFLAGADMTVVEGTVTRGPVDLTVSHYFYHEGNADATRIQVGVSHEIDKFDLRAYATYETGFDLPDIATAGLSAEYKLTNRFSLTGNAIVPFSRESGDPRSAQVTAGIKMTF